MAPRSPQSETRSVTGDADKSSRIMVSPTHMLTLIEGELLFDDRVRERLGISAVEFVRRYHSGWYDDILDDPDHADLMYLSLLGGLGE